MDAASSNDTTGGATQRQPLPQHAAIASSARTQTALATTGPTQLHSAATPGVCTPSPPTTIPTAQTSNQQGEKLLFATAVDEQKELKFSEVELEHQVDGTSEALGVNVVRGSVQETKTSVLGARITEDGELEVGEWVYTTYAVYVEQIAFQVLNTKAIEGESSRPYEPSATEKCCDCLCQAYTCNNLCGLTRRSARPAVTKVEGFGTESLRKARALGMKALTDVLWTPYTKALVGACFKDFSIYALFLISLGLWINVLVGFLYDLLRDDDTEDNIYRLVKLIFSSLNLVFAIFDAVHHTFTNAFTCCKQCGHCVSEVDKRYRPNADEPRECCTCCTEEHKCSCRCCPKCCTKVMDVARLIFPEMMNYPNLLLSVFQLLVQIVEKDGKAEVTTYISVILSLLIALLNVYISRWFVLAGSIFSVQKIRTGGEDITPASLVNTTSAKFHLIFVLNAIGHTIIQMAMIAAIGARFYHEYEEGESYLPSGQLWFMMVFGYVGPFLGVIMFLMTCHFWTQQFPIQFFLDYLKILQKPGFAEVLSRKKVEEKHSDAFRNLHRYLNEETLLNEFEKVRGKHLSTKLTYPFTSPLHVVLCLSYCGCLLAFGLCTAVDGPSSLGMIIFYVIATAFTILVNGYACAIAFLWVAIFAGVLLLIALFILLFIVCCMLSGSGTSDQKRRY